MAAKERQQGRGEGLPNVENLLVMIRRVGRREGGARNYMRQQERAS